MNKTFLTLTLLFITLNLFGYNYSFSKNSASMLSENHLIMSIKFRETSNNELDSIHFIQRLNDFSTKENINISQYNFLDETTLNIYSTNLVREPGIHLERGAWPIEDKYVSNQDEKNRNQTGIISFPLSSWKVRYYQMDQIRNVGVGDTFYLSTTDPSIAKKAAEAFSEYGQIKFQTVELNSLQFINVTLLVLVVFSSVILCIHIFFYMYKCRKQLYLQRLWGYSFFQSFLSVFFDINKPFPYITIIGGVAISILMLIYRQTYFLFHVIQVYLVVNLFALILLACIIYLSLLIIHASTLNATNLKGKPPFENYYVASIILKAFVFLLLFAMVGSAFNNVEGLNQQLKSKVYWNKTQNVYRIQVHLPNLEGDLRQDRYINDRIANFYQLIKANKGAFIINAQNFVNIAPTGKPPLYLFERNTRGEEQIYQVSGRRIDINENYLKYNPIISASGEAILEQVDRHANVMNILVPEKYKRYERMIKSNYLKYFYFQRVEVDNMYNKELDNKLNSTSIDELSVHVIYTVDNQRYFTYNSTLGDQNNKNAITDPIAVILNDSLDTSNIKAFATTSLFFEDASKGEAYNHIMGYLKQSDTLSYIHTVVSVYQEKNEQIVELRQRLIQQGLAIGMMLVLSSAFLIIFTWSYYMNNAYNLYLKYLFGYSYWTRNRWLLLSAITIDSILGAVVFLWLKSRVTLYCSVSLVLVEISLIYVLSNYFNIGNTKKILKGEKI